MKRSQNDTLHRVRAVQSWLEKAEASFDKESDIKGELNLMLAEAEMKNLRRHHPVHKRFCVLEPSSRPFVWWRAAGIFSISRGNMICRGR